MPTVHGREAKVKTMGGNKRRSALQIMSHDKEINEKAWQWCVANEKLIRAIVHTACRGCFYLKDELFSEACYRLPAIFANYDSKHLSGATICTKVVNDLKWYLWKWMGKRLKGLQQSLDEALEDDFDGEFAFSVLSEQTQLLELDTFDEVQFILGKLAPADYYVLALYHLGGNTFEEIGNILGVAKSTARRYYNAALIRAQELSRDL